MEFRPIQFDQASLAQYCALFAACFPGSDKFTPAYVNWLYCANPDGRAVGYDAWEGERLAAHYVCVPALARVNGAEVRVLLSLNTATHPDFQGKGLFTKLADQTFQAGADQGYDGVYGVANANSTPGFIRKLGFQLVRPLEARVGMGRLHLSGPPSAPLSFERVWNSASITWRCANPNNPVRWRTAGTQVQFHAPALMAGLPAYAELAQADVSLAGGGGMLMPLRLFIGLAPDQVASYWNYASIPQRLRPSPLNLIYRSFVSRVVALDPALIRFSFLDFDAY
jgi:GNAT superfamily N-acetyltransferase